MMQKRIVLAVGLSVAVGVGAVSAVASNNTDPSDSPYHGPRPATHDRPERESVGAAKVSEVRGKLAVLRRSRGPQDRVDPDVAGGPLLADDVAQLDEARRVRRAGRRSWIAPSANGEAVCQIAPGELNCPLAEDIREDGAAAAMFWHAEGPVRVSGITTDDIESVTVVLHDGSERELPVIDNQFVFEHARAPREVRWVGPRGASSQDLPDVPGR